MEQRKVEFLLEYQQRIDQKARENSSELISNGTIEHARILIASIFSVANKKIEIFTGFLNPIIYNDKKIIDSAFNFLKKQNTKIEVVVQENDHSLGLNEFVNEAKNNKQFVLKEANEIDKNEQYHFIVADSKSFRYEPDKAKNIGIGCFNKPAFAEKLNNRFQEIFKQAKTLEI